MAAFIRFVFRGVVVLVVAAPKLTLLARAGFRLDKSGAIRPPMAVIEAVTA